jgi:hypothetical protein
VRDPNPEITLSSPRPGMVPVPVTPPTVMGPNGLHQTGLDKLHPRLGLLERRTARILSMQEFGTYVRLLSDAPTANFPSLSHGVSIPGCSFVFYAIPSISCTRLLEFVSLTESNTLGS